MAPSRSPFCRPGFYRLSTLPRQHSSLRSSHSGCCSEHYSPADLHHSHRYANQGHHPLLSSQEPHFCRCIQGESSILGILQGGLLLRVNNDYLCDQNCLQMSAGVGIFPQGINIQVHNKHPDVSLYAQVLLTILLES